MNQTCPFLSQLGQSLSHSSLVGITVRYLPNVRLRVTAVFYHAELVVCFICFLSNPIMLIPRFFGFDLGRRSSWLQELLGLLSYHKRTMAGGGQCLSPFSEQYHSVSIPFNYEITGKPRIDVKASLIKMVKSGENTRGTTL